MPRTLATRMPTPAGERREVLEFLQPSAGKNEYGQPPDPPAVAFQTRGKVEPLSGRELDEARRLAPLATLQITVTGGLPTFDETYSIRHVNRANMVYNIGHILDVETRGRDLILFCHRETCP